MTDTKHKPDCPLHPNWTAETLVRGLKSCTCADKPTPPARTDKSCATCGWPKDHLSMNHDRCMVCGGKDAGFKRWKPPPAPTDAEVREARGRALYTNHGGPPVVHLLSEDYSIILAALDKAQDDLANVKSAAVVLLTGTINGYDQQMDNLSKDQVRLLRELETAIKEASK